MAELKEYLNRIESSIGDYSSRNIYFPEKSAIEKFYKTNLITMKSAFDNKPDNIDLDLLLINSKKRYFENDDSNFTDKELSNLLWSLSSTNIIKDNSRFTKALIEIIISKESPKLIKKLINFYLRSFDLKNSIITDIGKKLRSEIINSNYDYSKKVLHWRKIDKELSIFEPKLFINRMVNLWLKNSEFSLLDIFQVYNISSINNLFITFSNILSKNIIDTFHKNNNENMLYNYINFSKDFIELLDIKHIFANTILISCINESISKDLKDLSQKELLKYLKDPRLDNSRWVRVDKDAEREIKKWLNKESLEMFLNIVDKTADRRDQWSSRRRFWSKYEEKGYIDDAWVVFGAAGAEYADSFYETKLDYGKFSSSTGDKSHAVLLLNIRGVTVADWSHNGACRIWKENNTQAPEHYKKEYSPYDLRNDFEDFKQSHIGTRWQFKIAKFIRDETRVKI